jgi:ABC-type uncharacterized transport system substrate-binding protein
MRRREFITLIGGAAAWPLGVRAQQRGMPVVGVLHSTTPDVNTHTLTAFRNGLNETGFTEGQNISIEYRWAFGRFDRLPALARELIEHHVAVIAAFSPPAAVAAKEATSTLPIVMTTADDPVKLGLVSSLSRPSSNVTGVSFLIAALSSKRLELLHELVPTATTIGVLLNPNGPDADTSESEVQEASRRLGQKIQIVKAANEREIDMTFANLAQIRVGALLVASDVFFTSRREQIVELAARHAIPASYSVREFVRAGGLTSYGPSLADGYRLAGVYAGRILKGEKPAELPIIQPTKFDLAINLNTAKALGITVPLIMQMTADEVIE